MITKLLKYSEIPNDSLAQISQMYPYAHNCAPYPSEGQFSVQCAIAKDEFGKVICCVIVERHDSIYFASTYMVNPSASPKEAASAADAIDAMLAQQGQLDGVKKLLLPIPECVRDAAPDCHFKGMPCFVRSIPESIFISGLHSPAVTQHFLN